MDLSLLAVLSWVCIDECIACSPLFQSRLNSFISLSQTDSFPIELPHSLGLTAGFLSLLVLFFNEFSVVFCAVTHRVFSIHYSFIVLCY